MIRLLINGKQLEFDDKIRIKLISPLFEGKTTYSFPINIKYTKINRNIIGDLNYPENETNTIVSIPMDIITDWFSLNGVLKIIGVKSGYYETYFKGANNFWELAEKTLSELTFDEFEAEYFTIYNNVFYKGWPFYKALEASILNFDLVNARLYNDAEPETFYSYFQTPQIKLNTLFTTIIKNLGFNLSRNHLGQHSELSTLYFTNNNCNGEWEPQSSGDYQIMNLSVNSDKYELTFTPSLFWNEVDYIKIIDPNASHKLNNTFWIIEKKDDTHYIIPDASVEEYGDIPEPFSINGVRMLLVRTGRIEEMKNHIPDGTCKEMIKDVETICGGVVIPDESTSNVRFISWNEILKNPVATDITAFSSPVSNDGFNQKNGYSFSWGNASNDEYWKNNVKQITDTLTEKPSVSSAKLLPAVGDNNDVRLTELYREYYIYQKLSLQSGEGWKHYSFDFLNLTEGDGDVSLSTRFAPIPITFYENRWLPRMEKTGSFLFINEKSHNEFRLFFNRGKFFDNIDSQERYLCTPEVYDHKSIKLPNANVALRWDSEYGLVENFYKEYLHWQLNVRKDFSSKIEWPLWMINNFDFAKKIRIEYTNYLVKEIDLILTNQGVQFGDTLLAKVG